MWARVLLRRVRRSGAHLSVAVAHICRAIGDDFCQGLVENHDPVKRAVKTSFTLTVASDVSRSAQVGVLRQGLAARIEVDVVIVDESLEDRDPRGQRRTWRQAAIEVGSEYDRMALFVVDRLRLEYDAIDLRANTAVRTERD